jgi:hypothetical protein
MIKSLGFKQLGNGNDGSISYNCRVEVGDGAYQTYPNPLVDYTDNALKAWKFSINTSEIKKTFDFGNIKRIQCTLQFPYSYFVVAADSLVAGRIIVVDPSSGQLWAFSPRQPIFTIGLNLANLVWESYTQEFNVADVGSSLDVYFEPMEINGALFQPINTSMYLTIFNFNLDQ